jgi:hypothetical protein
MQSQAALQTYDKVFETFKASVKANVASLATLFNMLNKLKEKYPHLKRLKDESAANHGQRKKSQQALYHLDLRELLNLVSTSQNGKFMGMAVSWNSFKTPPALPKLISNMGHLLTVLRAIKVSDRGYAAKEHLVHGVANLTLENSLIHLVQASLDKKLSHPILIISKYILNSQAKQEFVAALRQSHAAGATYPDSILKEILGLDPVAVAQSEEVSEAINSARPATPPSQKASGAAGPHTPIATPVRRAEEEDGAKEASTGSSVEDKAIAYAAQYEDGSDTEEEELPAAVQSPGLNASSEVSPSQDEKLTPLFEAISNSDEVIRTSLLISAMPSLDEVQKNHLLDAVMDEICNNGKTVDDSELFSHFSDACSARESGGYQLNQGQRTILMAQALPTLVSADSFVHVQQLVAMHKYIFSGDLKASIIDQLIALTETQSLPPVLLILCINNWRGDINVAPLPASGQVHQGLTVDALASREEVALHPVSRRIDFDSDATRAQHSLINFLIRVADGIEIGYWDIELLTKIYAVVPKQEHLSLTEEIRDRHGFVILGDKIAARNAMSDENASNDTLQFVEPSSATAYTIVSDGSSSARVARSNAAAPLSDNYNLDAEPTDYSFDAEQCIKVLSHQASFTWLSPIMQQDFLRSLAKHYRVFTDTSLEGGEVKGLIQYNRLITQLGDMDSYDLRIKVLAAFANPGSKANPNTTHALAFRELQCWMTSVSDYIRPDLVKVAAQVKGQEENKGESVHVLAPLISQAQEKAQLNAAADAQAAKITAITTICYQCSIQIDVNEFPFFVEGYFTNSASPVIPVQYQGLVLLHMVDRINITKVVEENKKFKTVKCRPEAGSEAARFWQRTREHVTRFTDVLPHLANAIQIASNHVEEKSGMYKAKDEKQIKSTIKAQLGRNIAESKKDSLTNDIWDLIRYYKIIKKGQAAGNPLSETIPKLLDNTGSETKAKFASMLSGFRGISSPVKGVKQKLTNRDVDDQQSLAILMNDLITQLTRPEFDASGHRKEVDAKFVFKALLLAAHCYYGTDHGFSPFDEAVPVPEEGNDYFDAATAHGGSTIAPSAYGAGMQQHRAATRKGSVTGSSMHGGDRQRAVTATAAEKADPQQGGKVGVRPPSNYGGSQSSSRMYQSEKRAVTATAAPPKPPV